MKNSSVKRVEIIGCTASGKTSLCKTMQKLGWTSLYEPYENNPFLTDFYRGDECAFELQICFLLQHYNKINIQSQAMNNIVCDFSFFLDEIYASILLSEKELILYKELFSYIVSKVEPPEYIIKLTCPDDVITDRINSRNRNYETNIEKNFIKELNRRINNYNVSNRLIQINSFETDFFNVDEVYEKIVKKII